MQRGVIRVGRGPIDWRLLIAQGAKGDTGSGVANPGDVVDAVADNLEPGDNVTITRPAGKIRIDAAVPATLPTNAADGQTAVWDDTIDEWVAADLPTGGGSVDSIRNIPDVTTPGADLVTASSVAAQRTLLGAFKVPAGGRIPVTQDYTGTTVPDRLPEAAGRTDVYVRWRGPVDPSAKMLPGDEWKVTG